MYLKDLCIEIIRKCPNNCKFCSSESGPEEADILSIDQLKKIIDDFLVRAKIGEVQISGGEPFMHPDLIKMVEYCKQKGLTTTVYSSGVISDIPHDIYKGMNDKERSFVSLLGLRGERTHLNPETLNALKQKGLDKIVFDLPAEDSEIYKQIMNVSNCNSNVLKSMFFAANWAKIDTEIHFVPTKMNYRDFENVVFLTEQNAWRNIKQISVLRFVPQGRGEKNQRELLLSQEELAWFMKDVERIKGKYKVPIRLGIPLSPEQQHECTAGNNKFLVGANGLIYPCPAFKSISSKTLEKLGVEIGHINCIDKLLISSCKRKTPLCDMIHKKSLKMTTTQNEIL